MEKNAAPIAPRSILSGEAEGQSLSESVFRAIRRAMSEGIYRPGDRLREEEVSARFGVSRTPVREAFGRLAACGLAQQGAGRGLVVRTLDRAALLELYAFREILEGAAARGAAIQAVDAEIEALMDICRRFDVPGQPPRELAGLNNLFHTSILNSARNRFLHRSHEDLQNAIALQGPSMFGIPDFHEEVRKDHHAIAAAIADRNPDVAEQMARAHVGHSLRRRLTITPG